jgi:hypothetical protein
MKVLKQQIAIAESCGWTYTKTVHNPDPTAYGRHPTHTDDVPWALPLPDYLNDLNAMHEAEQSVWDRDWNLRFYFVDHLARIINPVHGYRMLSGEDLLDATAKQRAEAFLRTIGKWEESE